MKITFHNPAFPDDHVFYVDGLPALQNGKAVELSDEDVEKFEARWGAKPEKQLKGDDNFTVTTTGAKGGN